MRSAFSLVELSIVLVILGLLTGGILAGQSLIRASELRAVTAEYQRYAAAVNTFRDKYFALPGDMANAQNFWGVAHATPATCVTTVGTGTQTCNGDGNGRIDISAGSREPFRAWQHLANAGLIEGTYTGTVTLPTWPSSKISNNSTWGMGNWNYTGSLYWFDGDYGNVLYNGANNAGTTIGNVNPSEAWNIDTKMDDGLPAQGKLWGGGWGSGMSTAGTFCTTAASSATLTATYLLSNNNKDCMFVWRQQ
ncbi:MAG: prepilin-type N-terminal cleavage/methylation domain-containing protein [Alphaproteobacteria bacterium]|nr:prepilin-type N-terminal cleavage/methylation domain-containing protein [Alphaproteobacteria bacterium]